MKTQEGDREESQQHVLRRAHSYPFLEVIAPRKVIGLRNEGMEKNFHLFMQSSSDENVSLSGEITLRGPLV